MPILIVDDSLTVRMDLKEIFEKAGFAVELCSLISEARQRLARAKFDLAVLDVQLPDGDGVELLRELRSDPRTLRLPAILLSTEAEIRNRIRGLSIGADDFVGKPYDPGYLINRARELMLPAGRPASGLKSARVLVIDDSASVRESLRQELESVGYEVLLAQSGEEGLQIVASGHPSAAIIDSGLPGIDGATVIRRLRSDAATRHLPCIMLTGGSEGEGELAALDAGADSYIRKGEDLSVILARLAALLGAKQAGGEATGIGSVFGPKRLLVLSDGGAEYDQLAQTLKREQYEVVLAKVEAEVSEYLSAHPVDAILLLQDFARSAEVCRRVKSSPASARIPVIVLVAPGESARGIELLSAGADDFVVGSGDHALVTARLRAQLRRKQFEREDQLSIEARANRELAEARAVLLGELEATNWELDCFNSSISHDLRAPLRSVLGFTQILLEDHAERLGPDGQDALRRIHGAAERMSQLIEDLLKLARIDVGQLRRQQADLSEIARSVAANLHEADPSRAVRVSIQEGVTASGDPKLLRIVLENLIGNAWKYSSKNPSPAIEFGAIREGDSTVYFVRDNGVGFDMKHASKLFGVFKRLHSESEFPGTGIGLVTVQRIVRKHGGRIWAESAVGQGATFRFVLG